MPTDFFYQLNIDGERERDYMEEQVESKTAYSKDLQHPHMCSVRKDFKEVEGRMMKSKRNKE